MPDKSNNITEGKIHRGILDLALPSMVGLILLNIFSLVDMYFVGWLGYKPLAAVSLGSLFVSFIYTFALGISTGTLAVVSRYEGAGCRDMVKKAGRQTLYLSFLMWVVVMVLGNIVLRPALEFLGAGPGIIGDAEVYSRIMITFSFVVFIPMGINAYLRGYGDTVTPMRMMGMASVINGVLDPVMIFGWLGFPALGVAGSAVATVVARCIGAAFLIHHVLNKNKNIRIKIFPIKLDFDMMFRIFKIGIYGSLQSAIRNLSSMMLMKFVAVFGPGVIAVYGVALRLHMAVILPLLGLGTAASTMVGQNLGAGKPDRAIKSGWLTMLFGEGLMILAFSLFYFKAEGIIGLFNKNPVIVKDGILLFHYLAVTFFFINLSIIVEKALGGAGDTFSPMVVSFIILFLVRLPLAYYLMQYFGAEGIWMGVAFSSILQGIIFAIWFSTSNWIKKKV